MKVARKNDESTKQFESPQYQSDFLWIRFLNLRVKPPLFHDTLPLTVNATIIHNFTLHLVTTRHKFTASMPRPNKRLRSLNWAREVANANRILNTADISLDDDLEATETTDPQIKQAIGI